MLLHSAIIFIKDKFLPVFGGNVIKLNLIGEVENRAEVKQVLEKDISLFCS